MRKKSVGKALTTTIVFVCLFCLFAKYGVYAAAVVSIFLTARIIGNWN